MNPDPRAANPTNAKRHPMKPTLVALLTLSIALCSCGTAKVASRREVGATPTEKVTTIYVADFDLDAANITSKLEPSPASSPCTPRWVSWRSLAS